MSFNRVKLFSLYLAFFAGSTSAQETKQFSFRNLTVNEGLSQNSVVNIAQDSIGYIWFATQDGLNKYDSKNFTYYSKQFHDITRPNYSQLGQLYTDGFGDFWIYSLSGWLEKYNYATKTFEGIIEIPSVTKIYRPSKEKLWLGTLETGLSEIDLNTKATIKLFPETLNTKSIFDIINVEDTFLLATSKGIYQIQENKIVRAFSSDTMPFSVLAIKDHLLFAGTFGKGLQCYDLVTKKKNDEWCSLFPSQLNIQDILIDSKSRLWIATYGNGVFVKEPKHKTVKHFLEKKDNPYALHYNDVLTVFEDNTGVIWLGTDGAGLSYYDEHLSKFNLITNNQVPENVSVDVVRAIEVDDHKTIWLGTSGKGLTSVYPLTEAYTTYTTKNSAINSDRIMSLCFVNGDLWMGFQNNGLQIKQKDGLFKTVNGLEHLTIWKIYNDRYNYIWLCTQEQGLIQLDKNAQIIKKINRDNSGLTTNTIRTIEEDPYGNIWIGTETNGLFKLDTKTQKVLKIEDISDKIKSLYFKEGHLWIGTNGNGIKAYTISNETIASYTTDNGLANDVIYGILPDAEEHLWLSSNKGISRLSLKNNNIENYSKNSGLQDFEFNTGAYYKDDDGTLYFGGLAGVNWFKPSEITSNEAQPKTVISKLELFGKEQPLNSEATYKHNQNTLTFTFAGLHFSEPDKNLYSYKLQNHDAEWSSPNYSNLAHYTNLPPNDYTFAVISSNYDGVWNKTPTKYKFSILNPWYKTTLAYVSYALLLVLVLYGIYSYFKFKWKLETQVRLEHAETERLKELDDFKTKLYTNISHEFRTPLTLISGPIDKQLTNKNLKQSDKEELQLVKQNALRLLGLVNQMMDLSLIDAGQIKLKVEQGNLGIILKQLVSAFQYKANEKNITITSKIANLEHCWFDRDIIEKIGSNLLSNAIKYAPEETTVYLDAKTQNDQLFLSVINQNNQVKADKLGKLFERFYQNNEASEGIGVGLALVKDLVTLSKGTILANTLDNYQIQFNITLPITEGAFEIFELAKRNTKEVDTKINATTHKEKATILVIDDEADILNFVASIFQDTYNVIKTTKSKDALELVKQQLPDLVISDIMMPEIDGIELCKLLKKDTLTSHIPIILLTAKVTQDQQREGLETGADAYVTKPFNADILKIRVDKLIETRAQLKQRFNEQPILTEALEVTSVEAKFMQHLKDVLDAHLVNPEFTSNAFSKYMLMSRTQLHRKLKAIVGMSTSEFIRSQRLLLARDLLKKQSVSISEVAYLVGFNSVSYFVKCFKGSYNETPSQFIERHNA